MINRTKTLLKLFSIREYALFWIAAVCSNLGVFCLMTGRLWLMQELTDSPAMLGLLAFSNSLPILLLSVWGGVIADRINRINLIIITRTFFCIQALITGLLIALDKIEPWHLILFAILTGVLFALDLPARHSIVANIVPQKNIPDAIVMYSLIFGGSSIIGPAIFPQLIRIIDVAGVFYFVGIAYLATVILLSFMHPLSPIPQDAKVTLMQEFTKGFKYIRNNRLLRDLILLTAVIGILGSSYGTILPALTKNVLQGDVNLYSNLLLIIGVGGLIGTISVGYITDYVDRLIAIKIYICILGLALLLLANGFVLSLVFASALILGFSSSAFGTSTSSYLQILVDDEFRGRLMSIYQLGFGLSAFGGLLIGVIAEFIGIEIAIDIFGILIIVFLLLFHVFGNRSKMNLIDLID